MAQTDTLTKQKLVRQISRQTGHPNWVVREVVDELIDLVGECLTEGGRLEIENFLVLEIKHYGEQHDASAAVGNNYRVVLKARLSRRLRQRIVRPRSEIN